MSREASLSGKNNRNVLKSKVLKDLETTEIKGDQLQIEDPKTQSGNTSQQSAGSAPEQSATPVSPATNNNATVRTPNNLANVFGKEMFNQPKKGHKTFVLDQDIIDALDTINKDARGRFRPGAKGIIAKIANNALYEELIKLGVLDISMKDHIRPYK